MPVQGTTRPLVARGSLCVTEPSKTRVDGKHGISYSLTLHGHNGKFLQVQSHSFLRRNHQ